MCVYPQTPSIIYIQSGPGEGQWRRIIANTSNTIIVDRPWDVVPDTTSIFSILVGTVNQIVFSNRIDGIPDDNGSGVPNYLERICAAAGVETFGTTIDTIIDNNTITNERYGIFVTGWAENIGSSSLDFEVQTGLLIKNNTVNSMYGAVITPILTPASGVPNIGDPNVGPPILNNTIRDNSFSGVAGYGLWVTPLSYNLWNNWALVAQNTVFDSNVVNGDTTYIANTVFNNNSFNDTPTTTGAFLDEMEYGTLLYNNTFNLSSSTSADTGIYIASTSQEHHFIDNSISTNFGTYLNFQNNNGLMGYWAFEEPQWNDGVALEVQDSSGMNGNGMAVGNAQTIAGGGATFDGNGSYVVLGDITALDMPGDMTVTAWIQVSANQNGVIISKYDYANDKGWMFCILGTPSNGHLWYTIGHNDAQVECALNIDSNWHFVAVVKSGTSPMTLYIDGVAVITYQIRDNAIPIPSPTGITAIIGERQDAINTWDFNGNMDDVRVYNCALSASQIAALAATR